MFVYVFQSAGTDDDADGLIAALADGEDVIAATGDGLAVAVVVDVLPYFT